MQSFRYSQYGDKSAPLLLPTSEDCCTPSAHPPIAGGDSIGAPLVGQFVVLTPPQAPEDSFECYLSFPERKSRGVMLLATDIFGLHTGRHAQMCDELAAAGFTLDRKKVHLFNPVKTIGQHTVKIRLHADVSVDVSFDVVSENPIEPATPAAEPAGEKTEKRSDRQRKEGTV